jgi:hypothetical protein
MGRICEFGEAALEQHIDWPIPENCVLVEYFCLPTTFSRFAVITPSSKHTAMQRCVPFNTPSEKGRKQRTITDAFSSGGENSSDSEHNRWDPGRLTEFYDAMKTKYPSHKAGAVVKQCRKIAFQYLQ